MDADRAYTSGGAERRDMLAVDIPPGMETLRERDQKLEALWARFGDVPMDPVTERLEAPFLGWAAGTHRETVWHWFDERHSRGVAYLLYGEDCVSQAEIAGFLRLKRACTECTSSACHYHHGGECRFPLVHEREPRITEQDGCIDFDFVEASPGWEGGEPAELDAPAGRDDGLLQDL